MRSAPRPEAASSSSQWKPAQESLSSRADYGSSHQNPASAGRCQGYVPPLKFLCPTASRTPFSPIYGQAAPKILQTKARCLSSRSHIPAQQSWSLHCLHNISYTRRHPALPACPHKPYTGAVP